MNICVCVKQVPDTNEMRIDPDTHTLVRKGAPVIMNPFDAYALEAALTLREQVGGSVTVLTMGPEQAKNVLESAFQVGVDDGYLITGRTFGGSDTLATSYILSTGIRTIEKNKDSKFDLILCGKQAIDGDTAQVGPEIAEHLNLPQVTYALDIEAVTNEIVIKREYEKGHELIGVKTPALVTVARFPRELRFPTLKTKMASKKKVIEILNEEKMKGLDIGRCGLKGSPTRVRSSYSISKEAQVKIMNVEELSGKLFGILKGEVGNE